MIIKRTAIGERRATDPDVENWIRRGDAAKPQEVRSDGYTARLTIDVTPELRGRIKVAAFRRGMTVADMLRAQFEREFPSTEGEA